MFTLLSALIVIWLLLLALFAATKVYQDAFVE
jgi:hypothetical protein